MQVLCTSSLGVTHWDVYDASSMNHSVPGGGGSVLFHTHTFSHFTGTYALLQLPFCMDSDVGCLYLCPFGMNPATAWSCVALTFWSDAMYTIGNFPVCCISCCIGTCCIGEVGTTIGFADVPCDGIVAWVGGCCWIIV